MDRIDENDQAGDAQPVAQDDQITAAETPGHGRRLLVPSGAVLSTDMIAFILYRRSRYHCNSACLGCHFHEMFHRELGQDDFDAVLAGNMRYTDQLPQSGTMDVQGTLVPTGLFYEVIRLTKLGMDENEVATDVAPYWRHHFATTLTRNLVYNIIQLYDEVNIRRFLAGRRFDPYLERPVHAGHHIDELPTTPVTTREGRHRTSFSTPPPNYRSFSLRDGNRAVDGPLPPHGQSEVGVPGYESPTRLSPSDEDLSGSRPALTAAERRSILDRMASGVSGDDDVARMPPAYDNSERPPPLPLRSSRRPAANALHLAPPPTLRRGEVLVQESHVEAALSDPDATQYATPTEVPSSENAIEGSTNNLLEPPQHSVAAITSATASIGSPTPTSFREIQFTNPTDAEPAAPFRRASTTLRHRSDGWRWAVAPYSPSTPARRLSAPSPAIAPSAFLAHLEAEFGLPPDSPRSQELIRWVNPFPADITPLAARTADSRTTSSHDDSPPRSLYAQTARSGSQVSPHAQTPGAGNNEAAAAAAAAQESTSPDNAPTGRTQSVGLGTADVTVEGVGSVGSDSRGSVPAMPSAMLGRRRNGLAPPRDSDSLDSYGSPTSSEMGRLGHAQILPGATATATSTPAPAQRQSDSSSSGSPNSSDLARLARSQILPGVATTPPPSPPARQPQRGPIIPPRNSSLRHAPPGPAPRRPLPPLPPRRDRPAQTPTSAPARATTSPYEMLQVAIDAQDVMNQGYAGGHLRAMAVVFEFGHRHRLLQAARPAARRVSGGSFDFDIEALPALPASDDGRSGSGGSGSRHHHRRGGSFVRVRPERDGDAAEEANHRMQEIRHIGEYGDVDFETWRDRYLLWWGLFPRTTREEYAQRRWVGEQQRRAAALGAETDHAQGQRQGELAAQEGSIAAEQQQQGDVAQGGAPDRAADQPVPEAEAAAAEAAAQQARNDLFTRWQVQVVAGRQVFPRRVWEDNRTRAQFEQVWSGRVRLGSPEDDGSRYSTPVIARARHLGSPEANEFLQNTPVLYRARPLEAPTGTPSDNTPFRGGDGEGHLEFLASDDDSLFNSPRLIQRAPRELRDWPPLDPSDIGPNADLDSEEHARDAARLFACRHRAEEELARLHGHDGIGWERWITRCLVWWGWYPETDRLEWEWYREVSEAEYTTPVGRAAHVRLYRRWCRNWRASRDREPPWTQDEFEQIWWGPAEVHQEPFRRVLDDQPYWGVPIPYAAESRRVELWPRYEEYMIHRFPTTHPLSRDDFLNGIQTAIDDDRRDNILGVAGDWFFLRHELTPSPAGDGEHAPPIQPAQRSVLPLTTRDSRSRARRPAQPPPHALDGAADSGEPGRPSELNPASFIFRADGAHDAYYAWCEYWRVTQHGDNVAISLPEHYPTMSEQDFGRIYHARHRTRSFFQLATEAEMSRDSAVTVDEVARWDVVAGSLRREVLDGEGREAYARWRDLWYESYMTESTLTFDEFVPYWNAAGNWYDAASEAQIARNDGRRLPTPGPIRQVSTDEEEGAREDRIAQLLMVLSRVDMSQDDEEEEEEERDEID